MKATSSEPRLKICENINHITAAVSNGLRSVHQTPSTDRL